MKKSLTYVLATLLAGFIVPASAAVSEEAFEELKAQLAFLASRVASLESENGRMREQLSEAVTSSMEAVQTAQTAEASVQSSQDRSGWTDTISLKGDFRYRYEHIDAERSDNRERNRVRARAELNARPTDNVKVGIGIATGGDDPVSTNQTLGGGASTKDVRLDLAYFSWQARPGVTVTAGKFKNPFHRPGGSGLVWDGDLRPEGLALAYEKNGLFVDLGFNFLESDSRSGNETIIYGLQTGFRGETGAGSFIVGAGYYDLGVGGREVYFGDDDDFFGNRFTCVDPAALAGCTYNNDFEELELFAEFSTEVGGQPLALFADLVQNQAADDLDTGWAVGLKYGKASSPGTWELGYTYQDLEADAVFGLLTDSDFAGGGTDSRGHVLRGAVSVYKAWKIGFTYLDTERNIDLGQEEDYQRFMLDMAFKF